MKTEKGKEEEGKGTVVRGCHLLPRMSHFFSNDGWKLTMHQASGSSSGAQDRGRESQYSAGSRDAYDQYGGRYSERSPSREAVRKRPLSPARGAGYDRCEGVLLCMLRHAFVRYHIVALRDILFSMRSLGDSFRMRCRERSRYDDERRESRDSSSRGRSYNERSYNDDYDDGASG